MDPKPRCLLSYVYLLLFPASPRQLVNVFSVRVVVFFELLLVCVQR